MSKVKRLKWDLFAGKTIGQKLTASFAIVTFITLILGGIGYYGAINSNNSINRIGTTLLPSVQSLQNMKVAVVEVYASQQALMNQALSEERRTQIYKDIENSQQDFLKSKSNYEALPQMENEAALWNNFLTTMEVWEEDYNEFIKLSRDYDTTLASGGDTGIIFTEIRDQFLNETLISYDEMYKDLMTLVTLNDTIAQNEVEAATSENAVLSSVSIIALIFGVATAVLLGFFITRSINSSLGAIILSLAGGSAQVDSASQQLSESSQSMAEGASEQAASLQETSSSLEEMSAQTKQNAQNAAMAEKAMKSAQPMVDEGMQAMDRMNKTMDDIKAASMETSKIMKTIDDIAFQTNLLALNAAVEAARAGEVGKGFAVVAEEVRNLAHKSAQAAKNTSELIEKSQERSDRGLSVARDVSGNLDKISKSVNDVSTLVMEISAASGEQASGIQQINTAMSEMDKTVQNNASNSEESASAAEELSSQAAELRGMIDQLVVIVGDTTQQNTGKKQKKQRQAHSVERSSVTYNDLQRSRSDRPFNKKSGLKSPKKFNAAELIPLDDNDLNGF